MHHEFPLEKLGRITHGSFVMPIQTEDIRQKAHAQFCLGDSQPQIVVLPPEPAKSEQFSIVTADFDELPSIKQRHRIDVRILDQHFWVPIEIGTQSFWIVVSAFKTAKYRVNNRGIVFNYSLVQLLERTRKYHIIRIQNKD